MSEPRGFATGTHGYLSIREVLDELVSDFDDVTISKIRFLESRGLIHPERTPSGYRKFYPADVERLRWILRQQRENFLPLKVIKRRLDLEDGRSLELPDTPSLFDDEMDLVDRDRELANVVSNIRQVARSTGEPGDPSVKAQTRQAVVNDSISTTMHDLGATPTPKIHLSALPHTNALSNSLDGESRGDEVRAATKHPNHPSQGDESESSGATTGGTSAKGKSQERVKATPAATVSSRSTQSGAAEGAADRTSALSDVSFSIDECASATCTTVEAIAELEEFGFIISKVIGGIPCFDGEDVIIAKAIIGLRAYGLEPRHLKSIRHAAQRDASLYGQVVAPLLRQRNPDAKNRAKVQLEELADRGSTLYEQILRAELRHLGG